jgi:hypothetical protein
MSNVSSVGAGSSDLLAVLRQQLFGNVAGSSSTTPFGVDSDGDGDSSGSTTSTAGGTSQAASSTGTGSNSLSPGVLGILIVVQEQQSTASAGDPTQVQSAPTAPGSSSVTGNADLTGQNDPTGATQEVQHGHHGHHGHGGGGAGGELSALLQGISSANGATSTSSTNPDGSTTTTIAYADGSKVSLTIPASASSGDNAAATDTQGTTAPGNSGTATGSNLLEDLIRLQAQLSSGSGIAAQAA